MNSLPRHESLTLEDTGILGHKRPQGRHLQESEQPGLVSDLILRQPLQFPLCEGVCGKVLLLHQPYGMEPKVKAFHFDVEGDGVCG